MTAHPTREPIVTSGSAAALGAKSGSTGDLGGGELLRYGRHLSLAGFGMDGQRRLRAGRVAIVGLGGLGSPAALYLAAAGVGTLGLIDGDRVDASNLQRQVLYGDGDVGQFKVDVATRRLRSMNGDVALQPHRVKLDSTNALEVLRDYDVVLDGTDNFPARYLINDASVLLGVPNVHGSVLRFEGRVSVFGVDGGPCYRCLFPEPPPPGMVQDCHDAGVLGVLPGLTGVLQATEVIKLLAGIGETLSGRMLIVEGLGVRFRTFGIQRNPACPACGTREIRELIDYDLFCGGSSELTSIPSMTPRELAQRMPDIRQIIDVREPWEWDIGRLPGARLIPIGDLESSVDELDRGAATIVYCHRGVRSVAAMQRLKQLGFTSVVHLDGGIDRWSTDVDGGVARY